MRHEIQIRDLHCGIHGFRLNSDAGSAKLRATVKNATGSAIITR